MGPMSWGFTPFCFWPVSPCCLPGGGETGGRFPPRVGLRPGLRELGRGVWRRVEGGSGSGGSRLGLGSAVESFKEAGAPPTFPASRRYSGTPTAPHFARQGWPRPSTEHSSHASRRETMKKGVPRPYNFGDHLVRPVSLLLIFLTLARCRASAPGEVLFPNSFNPRAFYRN